MKTLKLLQCFTLIQCGFVDNENALDDGPIEGRSKSMAVFAVLPCGGKLAVMHLLQESLHSWPHDYK